MNLCDSFFSLSAVCVAGDTWTETLAYVMFWGAASAITATIILFNGQDFVDAPKLVHKEKMDWVCVCVSVCVCEGGVFMCGKIQVWRSWPCGLEPRHLHQLRPSCGLQTDVLPPYDPLKHCSTVICPQLLCYRTHSSTWLTVLACHDSCCIITLIWLICCCYQWEWLCDGSSILQKYNFYTPRLLLFIFAYLYPFAPFPL